MRFLILFICIVFLFNSFLIGAKTKAEKPKDLLTSPTFIGMKFRNIGPAYASGRISDFAVNPNNPSEYYVGVAAGNVWKTNNYGITWNPVFDKYGSYSIASVVIDPNNTHVVWVGTGEYNSQRAIGYGDGVYRSEDGGKSWKNMGLKKSEHIGRILIDPRNSHVYVAAQGPLWGPGGQRGLYKTTDNGKTWNLILKISENTGVTDIVMDPRNPDILYAASYQRRRHVFTLINGGPESAIYKTTDAGKNWEKLKSGLPGGDVGRIGLTISSACPDVIYAIIEAEGNTGGFFRSTNRGETWEKRNSYVSGSPQYYNRIVADPKDVHKVYSLDTVTKVTVDGGKTFKSLGIKYRHVDDHALWIDPQNTKHLIIGGDGGIYETYDGGKNWQHKPNLPVTQFYRVAVDNDLPFYNVYGGTQDNNSLGGPSATISSYGILNSDWFNTNGGDGFQSRVDPKDPNIVYAQSQYGGIVRYNKKNGEQISIKPREGKGEAYRWNWNSPLIISPHSHTRLYFAANILFKSEDRGNSWIAVSGDLTSQIDRNKLTVMGKIQSPDAVAKNASTSLFGNIVSLTESPRVEGLLYVGTDDGLIQVTENGGENWRKKGEFPGIPEMTYVSCLLASLHNADTVYASFDGRKNSNLSPFLLKSTNRGKTWKSIKANLPGRGTVYTIAEDQVNPDLLFVGTEFGLFFTIDGGNKWIQLKSGLPTISVKDIAIQQRENDLVLATFGRGFYILDNYSPLREIKSDTLKKECFLFPVKDALWYIPRGLKYGQGVTYYKGENPKFGATFTYYLKEAPRTKKQKRKKSEKSLIKKGVDIQYPSFEQLRKEDEEEEPYILFTISDNEGNVIRRLKASPKSGINRIIWDLCHHNPFPVVSNSRSSNSNGRLVKPGDFKVAIDKFVDGEYTRLAEPQPFKVVPLNNTISLSDQQAMTQFQKRVNELIRVVQGASRSAKELSERVKNIKIALFKTPAADFKLMTKVRELEEKVNELLRAFNGDRSLRKRNANQPPSINGRVRTLIWGYSESTSPPTETLKRQYQIAIEEFEPQYLKLKNLIEKDLQEIEESMEKVKAPWTSGRIIKLKNLK